MSHSRFLQRPASRFKKVSIFEARSRLAPVSLEITRLSAGQERLDVHPPTDLLVLVENSNRRLFIRRGLNANSGTPQQEVFILKKDGSIEGTIEWDYETVTRVEARPIDPEPLVLRGGMFINIGMKNVLIEDCVLSRMDVHQGVSGHYTIRRSALGHMGINAIGRGHLVVEDSSVYCENLVSFRSDYGATWDGDVSIRNSRWVPPVNPGRVPVMFSVNNDGTDDFGYPCSMPRVIRIDGLTIDDSQQKSGYAGAAFFSNPLGALGGNVPFPYRPTERLEVRSLKTASGLSLRLSNNPEVVKALPVRLELAP